MPHFGGCDYTGGVADQCAYLYTVYGAALLDHVLLGAGFDEGALIGDTTGKQCEPSVQM